MNPTEDQPETPQPGPAPAPGAGMPLVPGPPASVRAPISATTYNISALVYAIVIGVLVIVVIAAGAWLIFGHR